MKISLFALFLFMLTGCALTPQSTPPVAVYDLGLVPTHAEPGKTKQSSTQLPRLLITDITSPAWLDNQAIHYRLAYHSPAQLYSYANSRWAAVPAALLTRQINNYIKTNTEYKVVSSVYGVQAEYTLHGILEDFSQIYEATDKSYVSIHLNVTLIERRTRSLLAQRKFMIHKTVSTTNAAGAVYALIEASNQLDHEITDWLIKELTAK